MTNKKKKRLNPILSSRDIEVMVFLWRHRIATFRALKEFFFSEMTSQNAYYQLRRLRQGEFVNSEPLEGTKKNVWTIAHRGFTYITVNQLLEIKTKWYRPQSRFHDLLVASALLGGWAKECPDGVGIVTEQEWRFTEIQSIPDELKDIGMHIPDGVWFFSQGKELKAVSLEVETSAKTDDRYDRLCAFYASHYFFEAIVWIIKDKALGLRIQAAAWKYGKPRDGLHRFILQRDFEKLGWNTSFSNESLANVTLGEFLNRRAGVELIKALHPRITHDSPSNHLRLEQTKIDPLLDFTVSLENLSTLRASTRPKNP